MLRTKSNSTTDQIKLQKLQKDLSPLNLLIKIKDRLSQTRSFETILKEKQQVFNSFKNKMLAKVCKKEASKF